MAEVFRATLIGAEGFERPVAIKRILPSLSTDRQFAEMFVNEARIASLLHHPNVVEVLDFDRDDDGALFMVMELVDGVSLHELMQHSPIPAGVATYIIAAVLDGLTCIHGARAADGTPLRLVHRDISPQNILITRDGVPKIADFGIAKAMQTAARISTTVRGKPLYMAPEQLTAPTTVDARADIFAAGAILYELLGGVPVYHGTSNDEVLADVVQVARGWRRIERLATVDSAPIADAVARMLEISAARRHATAASAAASLPTSARAVDEASRGLVAMIRDATDAPARTKTVTNRVAAMAATTRTAAHRSPIATVRRAFVNRGRPALTLLAAAAALVATAVIATNPDQVEESSATIPRLTRLTRRDDITAFTVSPTGDRLVVLTSRGIVVRGTGPASPERLIQELKYGESVEWVNDHAVVVHTPSETLLVDLADGTRTSIMAGQFSTAIDEKRVALVRHASDHSKIVTVDLSTPNERLAECAPPPPYRRIYALEYNRAENVFIVSLGDDETKHVAVMSRECEVERILPVPSIGSYTADADDNTIVHASDEGGSQRFTTYTLNGTVLRSELITGTGLVPVASRAGRLFVTRSDNTSRLEQFGPQNTRRILISSAGDASFRTSPDEKHVAWIETIDGSMRGVLRLERLGAVARSSDVIADHCVSVNWSPDSSRVVATVETSAGASAIVVDVHTRTTTQVPIREIQPNITPVWLTNERLLFGSKDMRTLRWLDLHTGRTGELLDRSLGWVFLVERAPNGTISFYWNRRGGDLVYWIMTPNGQPERTTLLHSPPICEASSATVSWRYDDRMLYLDCHNTLNLVDTETSTLQPLWTYDGSDGAIINYVTMLRDGRAIVDLWVRRLHVEVLDFVSSSGT